MSEDDLVRRLQVGHDSGCAMSYGMHEHCCDCSYPDRQESAETILKLRQDLAAARAQNQECNLLLSRVLHELAGSASLCWEPKPTGVFATELALGFVEDAIKELRTALVGEKR